MQTVFEMADLPPYERLVLLALADHADDNGRCYPSIKRLCDRTGMGERGVQKVIKRLSEMGLVSVSVGGGRGGTSVYHLTLNPASGAVNSNDKPRTENPVSGYKTPHAVPKTPHPVTLNPAPGAPEPSRTVIEPAAAARERLLAAMGADPVSGMIGPNGTRLGTVNDMAEAAKWADLGLSVDDQCRLIAERLSVLRSKNPTFAPRSFGYFSGAMADFAARKSAPLSASTAKPDDKAAKVARWAKIAKGAA